MVIFVFATMILLQFVVGTMAMGAFFRYKDKDFLPAAIALYLMMFRRIMALITWVHAPPSDTAASADLLVLPLCITLMICTAFLMSMRATRSSTRRWTLWDSSVTATSSTDLRICALSSITARATTASSTRAVARKGRS